MKKKKGLGAIFESGGCGSQVDEANIVADIAASVDEGGCALFLHTLSLLPSSAFCPK